MTAHREQHPPTPQNEHPSPLAEDMAVVHTNSQTGESVKLEQSIASPDGAEMSGLSRIRRAAGYIATRWREMRTPSTQNSEPDEARNSVDGFGWSKTLAVSSSLEADTERWSKDRKTGEFIKYAPRFSEQVDDTSRTNLIESTTKTAVAVGTQTQGRETTMASEHDTLVALRSFLHEAADYTNERGEHSLAPLAASLAENLTFIGEREYNEAVGLGGHLRRRGWAQTELALPEVFRRLGNQLLEFVIKD